ncbi:hypothetical protein CRX42_16370 [Pseudomonas jessenii]|jgi:hypothetical protein|uniref:Uncharacterized protein n=1 Tax=Pseudomonas jessenii TaxID=77298 RepID=A0A2W0ENE0_PSEJE|nr:MULTISPECIES: hypothetical protein [Pseudomonas]PYY69477.1 hypothetical protein CRX42_16370 [Pseudomonas jessenii]
MCPKSSQDSVTPTNINENARFDTPGETRGWTGEGEIKRDDIVNKHCWFSTDVQRNFGQQLSPSVGVRVLIRLRGLFPGETLIATHPAGVREITGLPFRDQNLYVIEGARADANGGFFVQFRLATRQTMSIESIQVLAPV